jgi:hypothetical protein
MKFYQRTGLGDSNTFMGGSLLPLLPQGLCQENDMAPAVWTMIAAVLMHCYKCKEFGTSIVLLISGWIFEFLGTIFVDDTDLNAMGENLFTSEQVYQYQEIQDSLYMLGNLLLRTGGALILENCFWCLVEHECEDVEWKYKFTLD